LPLWVLPQGNSTVIAAIPWILPVLLGVPVVDMVVVVFGRWRRGAALLHGDRTHLHHRLQRVGFSHEGAVGLIHLAMALVCMLQVLLASSSRPLWWMLALVPVWLVGYGLLGRFEKRVVPARSEGVRHAL
jgi:UDP-GlcNAc:undecaprenyl-phosphate GlcNAc-1-phosphate transferase